MTNTWKRIWITPFEKDAKGIRLRKTAETYPPTLRLFAFIHAERSDGQRVWVKVDVGEHEFDPSHVSVALQNALATLDTVWKDKESTND